MRTELVTLDSGGTALEGALHRPDDGVPVRGGVLLFHGNVGNFYTGPSRFLPPRLTALGLVCLAFNRRGHDIIVNDAGRGLAGGAFQLASEAIEDDDVAARYLADLGFADPVVIGHSNGGMLAGVFAATHPETRALVLLSAHAGGPETYWRSCRSGLMAADRAEEFEQLARSMVADGRGDELLLMPRWWYAASATSLLDRIDASPDLLAHAPEVVAPTIAIRGEPESAETYPMERFAELTAGPAEALIIPDCDHWSRGHETAVTEHVATWLDGVL